MTPEKRERRRRLLALLGDLPARGGAVRAKTKAVEERDGYVLETLELELNGLEPVPACFVKPKGAAGPFPAVLFNHSHGGVYGIGKDELIRDGGKGYLLTPSHAAFLTGLGYAALSIDAWGFGERAVRSEGELFKEMLWKGRVLWGMMVHDAMRAVDYLVSRPDVDAGLVGTMGISMGGTMAWWLSALDPRIAFCVDMCGLCEFETMVRERVLDRHGVYHFVPGLLNAFTAADIGALVSPRPRLSLSGRQDPLFPAEGVAAAGRALARAYARDGAAGAFRQFIDDCAHEESPAMRRETAALLKRLAAER